MGCFGDVAWYFSHMLWYSFASRPPYLSNKSGRCDRNWGMRSVYKAVMSDRYLIASASHSVLLTPPAHTAGIGGGAGAGTPAAGGGGAAGAGTPDTVVLGGGGASGACCGGACCFGRACSNLDELGAWLVGAGTGGGGLRRRWLRRRSSALRWRWRRLRWRWRRLWWHWRRLWRRWRWRRRLRRRRRGRRLNLHARGCAAARECCCRGIDSFANPQVLRLYDVEEYRISQFGEVRFVPCRYGTRPPKTEQITLGAMDRAAHDDLRARGCERQLQIIWVLMELGGPHVLVESAGTICLFYLVQCHSSHRWVHSRQVL